MFKYISDILSKFTINQRIFVLIFLLITIIIISIGPKIISSLSYDDASLIKRIEFQRIQIKELNIITSELNEQIIANQKNCTDNAIRRENEILGMISGIENYATGIKKESKNKVDTNNVFEKFLPGPNKPVINKDDKLISMIKKLKNMVSTK